MPKHFNLSVRFSDTQLWDTDFLDNEINVLNFSEKILQAICQALQIDYSEANRDWQNWIFLPMIWSSDLSDL
jgi:hypothetical protein